MSTWIVILSVCLGTYAIRASMFVALGRRTLPAWTAVPMSLIGPAALAALVISTLAIESSSVVLPRWSEIIAVLTGFVAVRRSGNIMHAFAVGMPFFWMASAVGF